MTIYLRGNSMNNITFPLDTQQPNTYPIITKNYQSMNDYIDNLFSRYARLLVLRVDLDYKKNKDISFMNTNEVYEAYWQAKVDREHLFKNTRTNQIFDDMVGYIWKLEYGKRAGFHNHMVFFYDGSKVQQDITIAKMIGQYWENNITQGRGRAYNCNAHKDKYKHCGIGMINWNNFELIANLKLAAQYLAKPDEYISTFMTDIDIGRTFGRGTIKERTETRGKPRNQPYPEIIL